MRYLLTLITLLAGILVASWFEQDYAANAWPHDWVNYCVDAQAGASAVKPGTDSDAADPAAPFAGHLADLDQRIATLEHRTPAAWLACAEAERDAYVDQLLWRRLPFTVLPTAVRPMDPIQVERAVERLLVPLRRLSEKQHAWLLAGPGPDEVQRRLQGKRQITLDDGRTAIRQDRDGLVFTLRELNAKSVQARVAAVTLGRASTVLATGLLAVWAMLAVCGLPSWRWALLAPLWLSGALLMVAISLGAPPLRTVAIRHLAAAGSWVWWPMVMTCVGVAAARLARHDRHLGEALLGFTAKQGLLVRALFLGVVALGIAILLGDDAKRAEAWLAVAVTGLAMFAARNANLIAVTNRNTSFGWPLVAAVGAAVLTAALLRHDRGSALLTVGLLTAWMVYFAPFRWALATLVAMAMVVVGWSAQLRAPEDGPLRTQDEMQTVLDRETEAVHGLRNERLKCAASVQVCEQNDVFRTLEMARAGWNQGWSGFGLAKLPANGLAADRVADRVVLQLPMDYIASPFVAAYGKLGLAGLAVYVLMLLALGARALAQLRHRRSPLQHLLAAVAGFGLVAVGLRVLITTGGALSAVPLTGLPAPWLAYGTSASLAFGLYLGLALGSESSTRQAS